MRFLKKFTIYKERSALQLSIKPGNESTIGCAFFEGARLLVDDRYDWKNKVLIALVPLDVGKLLAAGRAMLAGEDRKVEIVHESSGRQVSYTKRLFFYRPKDSENFELVLRYEQEEEPNQVVKIEVTEAEWEVMRILMETGIRDMMGWDRTRTIAETLNTLIASGGLSGGVE